VITIRCLGVVGVSHPTGDTSLAPAQRFILSILAAAGPAGISSEAIAEEIYYGAALPDKWNSTFRSALFRLRKSVDVITTSGHYRIDEAVQTVDIWQLRQAGGLDLAQTPETELCRLMSGEPFAGIEPSPLIARVTEEVSSLRIDLVQRMLGSTRSDWSPATLQTIRTLVARDHYRENLLKTVVQLHHDAGQRSEAGRLVEAASNYLQTELGVSLDPTIRSLAESESGAVQSSNVHGSIDGRVIGVSPGDSLLGSVPRPQLAALVNERIADGGVLIQGESGAGKTALLQSLVAGWSKRGNHALWLTGRRGSAAAYGSFLAVTPSMEQDLAPLLEGAVDDALLRSKCWAAARRRLSTEFAGLPLIIVVDDAQWLDSHSQQLVDFLASSSTEPRIQLVVAGRDSQANSSWRLFADGLERAGLKPVAVGDFSMDDLVELVGLHHPGSTSKQRRDFAHALVDRKAALPLVAHEIAQSAAPDTWALVPPRLGSERTGLWSNRVDESTRTIAAVAAVLGTTFRVGDLALLGGFDVELVVQATDELQDAEILENAQRPDEFSFRHVLIQHDFDGVLNRGERRRLHLDAADLADAADDVHARAVHVVEAGALVDNSDVVEAVLESARAFHQQGSYREAVAAFTQARALSDIEISPKDLLAFAEATASSGGDSWDVRSTAFELASGHNDAALSLEIALEGVQRTEDAMGDERRIAMLERVESSMLSEELQVAHAAALAREFGLLGRHEHSLRISGQAVRSATTPANRMTAWLGGWAACRSIPPTEWPPLPDNPELLTDPELGARLTQIELAQALLLGHDDIARSKHQTFRAHPAVKMDPLRTWHARLVTAMFSFVDGEWEQHDCQANAALEVASQHGVVAAFSTRAAQGFMRQWVVGQHGQLLPQLEAAPPDLQRSFLARAALAVTLAQYAGRHNDAAHLIQDVALRASQQRSPFSHPAAGILASAPSELLTKRVRAQLQGVLEPFAGTALVVGAAVAHAGPVSWSLANLATESDERIRWLRLAVDEADRWRLRLWSVRCRVDLASATGDSAILEEARRRAQGTELAILLPANGRVTAVAD